MLPHLYAFSGILKTNSAKYRHHSSPTPRNCLEFESGDPPFLRLHVPYLNLLPFGLTVPVTLVPQRTKTWLIQAIKMV